MSIFQSWWFKLYTRPLFLELGKYLLICLTIDVLLTTYGGVFKIFSIYLIGAYPAALFFVSVKGSFRSNIEFHKMSVPFPDLKKAFLSHIVLTILAISLAALLHIMGSYLLGGIFSHRVIEVLLKEIRMYEITSVVTGALIILMTVMFWSKDQKYIFYQKPNNLLKNILNFFIFMIPATIYVIISEVLSFSEVLFIYVPMLSIAVGSSLFHSRAIFHQEKPKGLRRDMLKYSGLGYAVCFGIYFLCVQMAKSDLYDSSLDPRRRAEAFSFMKGMSPAIDQEIYYSIGKHVDYMDVDTFYRKLDFTITDFNSDMYAPTKLNGFNRLLSALQSRKVDKNFLIQLYDHFEKHPSYWNNYPYFSSVQYQAFLMWPKDEKLPERFIAKSLSAKEIYQKDRLAAKERRKKALERKTASENSGK